MKLHQLLIAACAVLSVGGAATTSHAEDDLPGIGVQPASYFYTGKPYDQDLGAYVFAYRNYDPEINRWTTADPSGFPDGANPRTYVSNHCLSLLDTDGLKEITVNVTWTVPVVWHEDRFQPPGGEHLFWSWSRVSLAAHQGAVPSFTLAMHKGKDVDVIYDQAMLTIGGGGPQRTLPSGIPQDEIAQYSYKAGSASNLDDSIVSKTLTHADGQQSTRPTSTLDQWSAVDNHNLSWTETWIE